MEEQEKNQETVEETTQETTQEVAQEPVQETPTTNEANSGRPTFLTVLCILTFIWSGFAILGSLLAILGMGALMSMVGSSAGGGTLYMIVLLLITVVSLFGAFKMWGLNKQGFTIYAAANGIGLIVPYIFGTPFTMTSFLVGLLITGGFIVMYYLNLKHMS